MPTSARRQGGQAAAPPGGGRARRWARVRDSPGWGSREIGVPGDGDLGDGDLGHGGPGRWGHREIGVLDDEDPGRWGSREWGSWKMAGTGPGEYESCRMSIPGIGIQENGYPEMGILGILRGGE